MCIWLQSKKQHATFCSQHHPLPFVTLHHEILPRIYKSQRQATWFLKCRYKWFLFINIFIFLPINFFSVLGGLLIGIYNFELENAKKLNKTTDISAFKELTSFYVIKFYPSTPTRLRRNYLRILWVYLYSDLSRFIFAFL